MTDPTVPDGTLPESDALASPPVRPAAEPSGLGRASAILAAGTVVSRILGFARGAVLAAAIGQTASSSANAFGLANQLPNNIYALVAGGVLSAVLVPQIVKAGLHADGGQKFINRVVTLGIVIFAVVTVIATIAAPALVTLYAQHAASGGGKGFNEGELALAATLAYWCLPQIFFYALYSLLSEVLNARRIFGPFTWAPVLNNVVSIGGLIAFMAVFGGQQANSGIDVWSSGRIILLGSTTTLGVAAQALILFFFWRRAGLKYTPDFRWRGVGLGATGKAAGWLFGMVLITQVAGIFQSRVASQASTAGIASLQNSWLIFMLPHSVVAVSIATAYFTRMSGHAGRGDLVAVRSDLSASLRSIGMLIVFAAVALSVVALPFARVYEEKFINAQAMSAVILAFLPGLVLFSMLFIVQRVFYALGDTRTPFFMQCVQSGLFVIGALLCSSFLAAQWIGVGIAAVTSVAGSAQAVVALIIARRRLSGIDGRLIVRRHVQYLVYAVVAGAVGVVVVSFLGGYSADGFAQSGRFAAVAVIAVAGLVMAIVYFGMLALTRNPQLDDIRSIIRRRLHPKR